jgi:hypothetical protein
MSTPSAFELLPESGRDEDHLQVLLGQGVEEHTDLLDHGSSGIDQNHRP